jgi:hypothetical protein
MRNTYRIYQQHPRGAPDGTLSNAQARVERTSGEFSIASELNRTRIFDGTNPFVAGDVGRYISVFDTPSSGGSDGTRLHEGWTYRITAVDGGGNWATLEGFRAEYAGTVIKYVLHASIDFQAASASFPIDEGPLGPNAAPSGAAAAIVAGAPAGQMRVTGLTNITDQHIGSWLTLLDPTQTNPANSGTFEIVAQVGGTQADVINLQATAPDAGPFVWSTTHPLLRSNTGPVIYQSIFLPTAVESELRAYPWDVTDRLSATQLRLSIPWPDTILDIPLESSLEWYLRDRPAVQLTDLFKMLHRFYLQVGYQLHQHRGRNETRSALFSDMVYETDGENTQHPWLFRSVMGAKDIVGTARSGTIDWACYGAWDRVAAASDPSVNQGYGIHLVCAVGQINSSNPQVDDLSTWASGDGTNTTGAVGATDSRQGGAWNGGVFGPCSQNVSMGFDGDSTANYAGNPLVLNALNTAEGGDITEIEYIFLATKDELHLFAKEAKMGGRDYIVFGGLGDCGTTVSVPSSA